MTGNLVVTMPMCEMGVKERLRKKCILSETLHNKNNSNNTPQNAISSDPENSDTACHENESKSPKRDSVSDHGDDENSMPPTRTTRNNNIQACSDDESDDDDDDDVPPLM